uniref:Uncharacterized protein n=1 Tax=Arundo donax TaxID=35708 RepID=A0A0A9A6Y9_ARUDO
MYQFCTNILTYEVVFRLPISKKYFHINCTAHAILLIPLDGHKRVVLTVSISKTNYMIFCLGARTKN